MRLLIVFIFLTINICLTCRAKIKMDIYYESLCPDSIKFINEQLSQNYESFKEYLDIDFIPFGKSSSYQAPDGSIKFECQHGPDECFGNKVQGCMLKHLPQQDLQVAYVSCQMRFGADRQHRECVEAFGVSWEQILQCIESDFGTKQQLAFERISGPVLQVTSWVPSVVYNGQISQYTHTGNSPPLKDVLCQLCSNSNPACQQH